MAESTTASVARGSFSELVNRAAYGKERVVIESRGKARAAIVPLEDLALIELFERTERELDLAAARKALSEAAGGGTRSWAEIKSELGL